MEIKMKTACSFSEGTNPVRERQASVHTYVEEAEPRQAKPWLFVNEQII